MRLQPLIMAKVNTHTNMKYIITEQQHTRIKLLRREDAMKEKIDRMLNTDSMFVPFNYLLLTIANNVGIEMADEANLEGDEFITFRNQVKQYVNTNFYQYIKDFWKSHQ